MPQMEQAARRRARAERIGEAAAQGGSTATPTATPQTGAAPSPAANAPAANQPPPQHLSAREPPLPRRPESGSTPRGQRQHFAERPRIDDLALVQFRETVDPKSRRSCCSRPRTRLSPIMRKFGWVPAQRSNGEASRTRTRCGSSEGNEPLTPNIPVTLNTTMATASPSPHHCDRTIAICSRSRMKSPNVGNTPSRFYPFALISRHGTPQLRLTTSCTKAWSAISRSGPAGEYGYKKIDDAKAVSFKVTNGWLGITDNTGRRAALPDTNAHCRRDSRPISSAPCAPIRPTTCRIRKPSRSAAPAAPMRAVRRRQGSQRGRHLNFPLGGPRRYNKQLSSITSIF